MSSPIQLEWEENGLHVTIDVDELRGCVLELDGSTLRGVMHAGQALAFYEHVGEVLGEHYREASAARADVVAGRKPCGCCFAWSSYCEHGEPLDEVDGLDITDPKHPRYAENLRELADELRERDRLGGS